VEVEAAEVEAVEAVEAAEVEAVEVADVAMAETENQRQRNALEAVACIRMHQKSTETDRANGANEASGEYKVFNRGSQSGQNLSELFRTGWNLSGVTSAVCRT
jgi:hypothetical protein